MNPFDAARERPHGRPRRLLLALAGATVLVSPPASSQDRTAEVDRIFGFATPTAPGCVVGVSQRGEVVVSRAYGLADVERGVPLGPGTRFDVGSTQKQFAAAAVLVLVEDGRLSLSDDVRRYLPELPDYGHVITVDHLLTHTSGVRDWTGLLPLAADGTDVLALVLRQRGLNFTPGEAWAYSNSGYVLLKEIVARVSGRSFAAFVRERVFEPLGMASSAYVPDILQGAGERARAYRQEGNGWTPFMRLGNERGGGTVVSTAADLLRWTDALARGQLGPFVTGKLQEPARLANGRTLTYARGLTVETNRGRRMVWHSGGAAGYSALVSRFPDHALSVAVLCNFDPVSATGLGARVADLFLPPADAPEAGPAAAPGVDVAGRAGLYFDTRTGEPLRLAASDGRLSVVNGPTLVPVSADRFRPQRPSLSFRSGDAFEVAFRSPDTFEVTSMEGATETYRRAEPWTPTAADLRAFEGRYRSDELGTVLEVLPGPNGLVIRSEQDPAKSTEFAAVARDTYIQRLAVARFERDAQGNVTGFAYGNPLVRRLPFTRVGDRAAGPPAAPAPSSPSPAPAPSVPDAAPLAAPALDGLVGAYAMGPGRALTITLENGQLHGEPAGNPKRPLVHVSGATFAVGQTERPITVTFALDADGRATGLVMRQNGNERTLPRMR